MRRLAYGDACTTSSGTSAGHDCAVSRRSRRVDAALLSLPLADLQKEGSATAHGARSWHARWPPARSDRPRHPRRLERAEALHGGGGAGAVAGQCQSLARLCLLAGRRLARRRFAGGGGRLLEPARLEVEVGWPLLLRTRRRGDFSPLTAPARPPLPSRRLRAGGARSVLRARLRAGRARAAGAPVRVRVRGTRARGREGAAESPHLEQHCRPLGCRVVQPPRGAARGGVGCRPSGCLGEQSGRPFPVDGERALEAGRPRPPAGSMGEAVIPLDRA